MKRKVVIIGATGLIGRQLCEALLQKDFVVVAVSRDETSAQKKLPRGIDISEWDGVDRVRITNIIDGCDVMINLAGENLASGRWTKAQKQRIVQSRVMVARTISKAMHVIRSKPQLVIQASATGYYGSDPDAIFTESSPKGKGYLAKLCGEWEQPAKEYRYYGIRTVILRTGVVLSKKSEMIRQMKRQFRFFVGGYLGNGKQWLSWIHIDDAVGAILHCIDNEKMEEVVNITSPEPVKIKTLASVFAKVLNRPSWLPVPAFALRLMFGEMADETILSSCRAIPEKLEESGFEFRYPELENALKEILEMK